MDVADLVVTKGLVAKNSISTPQIIQVTATTPDIRDNVVNMTWEAVDNDETKSVFATAKVIFGSAADWRLTWDPTAHLVTSRIDALAAAAREGKASLFPRNMAYALFARNLVEYADAYRGMHSVVMQDLEGFAEVKLTEKEHGSWTVPPYFIDSVAHLAGFIMNCSDAMDTRKNFCVTPGWKSMRFAQPLTPGARYRSYVKMIPSAYDPSAYFGDVYILQNDAIIGQVRGIKFHRYPRILLDRFFSPTSASVSKESRASVAANHQVAKATPINNQTEAHADNVSPTSGFASTSAAKATATNNLPKTQTNNSSPAPAEKSDAASTKKIPTHSNPAVKQNPPEGSISSKAMHLIAGEAALEVSELDPNANFADLGVDSLMSLVITEKLKKELNVSVSGSLFLDYPTIGDLCNWLEEYHS
jgi:monodictyphenone polyketide synthase